MIQLRRLILGLALLCAAPAHARELSGSIAEADPEPAAGAPIIGILADSQLQSLPAWGNVNIYRGPLADRFVKVTIRPPALDWSSRFIMLAHLEALRARGAQAIFYLGDGANNGCADELSAGLDLPADVRRTRPIHEQGLLALLDSFRHESRIPVFFVLGNHDFLGAGNTSIGGPRAALCRNPGGAANPAVTKAELIRLVDGFNTASAGIAAGWQYRSSVADGAGTEEVCREPSPQRRWGCYLAATVDHEADGRSFQFLLLDTNDYFGVSLSNILGAEMEGLRGAMSWGPPRGRIPSQTGWFDANASAPVTVRIGLSHYDVGSFRKHVPFLGAVWNASQQFMNVFTSATAPRQPIQEEAYVISAHTHAERLDVRRTVFSVDCGWPNCGPEDRFPIRELNVGSTTDYPNVSALVQIEPPISPAQGRLRYQQVSLDPPLCEATVAELATREFTRPVREARRGERALGIDRGDARNYGRFTPTDLHNLFDNLTEFVGDDPERAICIGRIAAAVEAGEQPPYR